MSKKTRQNKVPMFLRLAFQAAKEADETQARSYLDKAISHGYQPNPKTQRDLSFTLYHARRDLGLAPPLDQLSTHDSENPEG